LHETARDLPPLAKARLREARVAALRDWTRLARGLQRALAILPDAIVLKGACYAQEVYAAPELRPCGDIDLLHLSGELPGYAWSPVAIAHESAPGWHEKSLVDPVDPSVIIDLHRGFAQPERTRLDVGALCARSVPGAGARVLDRDDAVVVHAVNLAVHELRVPLVQVADLARLWGRCRPAVVLERAREARVVGALVASLDLLARCAGERQHFAGARVAELEPVLEEARADLSRLARRGLSWAVSRYDFSRRPLWRLEQLLRKALFIDRPGDRVRFALSHIRRATERFTTRSRTDHFTTRSRTERSTKDRGER
jgi:hypothetical protein